MTRRQVLTPITVACFPVAVALLIGGINSSVDPGIRPWLLIGAALSVCLAIVGIFSLLLTSSYERPVQPALQPTPLPQVGSVNVSSHGQSGGITAHTVNIRPRLEMTAELKEHIARSLDHDRGVVVFAKDHGRGPHLANQLFNYLTAEGFTMNGFVTGDFQIEVEEQVTLFKDGYLVHGHLNIFGKNQIVVIDTSV